MVYLVPCDFPSQIAIITSASFTIFSFLISGANLLKKFRYACKYEDRSANGQILNFIRNFVSDFENEHGDIKIVSETK